VGKSGHRHGRFRTEAAQVVIGGLLNALATRQKGFRPFIHKVDEVFIIGRGASPKTPAVPVRYRAFIQEGKAAIRRSALSAHVDTLFIARPAQNVGATRCCSHEGRPGIIVAVLHGILGEEERLAVGILRIDRPDPHQPFFPDPLLNKREVLVPPVDRTEAQGEIGEQFGIVGERGGQGPYLVADLGRAFRISAILGLAPEERLRLIGSPAEIARPLGNRIKSDRHPFGERQIGHILDQGPARIPNLHTVRKAQRRHQIGIGPVNDLDQDCEAVWRGLRRPVDRRAADPGEAAVFVRKGELAAEIVVEELLIVTVPEQILVGRRRCAHAPALLDHRPLRNERRGGGGRALRRNQPADDPFAVGHPLERVIIECGVEGLAAELTRTCAAAVEQPERDRVHSGQGEGDFTAVRRPGDIADAGAGGEPPDGTGGAVAQ